MLTTSSVDHSSGAAEATSATTVLPLTRLLVIRGKALPDYLSTLPALLAHVQEQRQQLLQALGCERAQHPPEVIVHPHVLAADPPPHRIVMNCLGYLGRWPLLRILVMHLAVESGESGWPTALRTLEELHGDATLRVPAALETALQRHLLPHRPQTCVVDHQAAVADVPVLWTATPRQLIQLSAFTHAVRLHAKRKVRLFKDATDGTTHSLAIIPSSLAVGSYGLYLKGAVPANTAVAAYAGEEEKEDRGGGYRMMASKGKVIDAKVIRSTCAMMNDATRTLFSNNCRFKTRNYCISAVTIGKASNEELFVSYGQSYKMKSSGGAEWYARAVVPDIMDQGHSTAMPAFQKPCI